MFSECLSAKLEKKSVTVLGKMLVYVYRYCVGTYIEFGKMVVQILCWYIYRVGKMVVQIHSISGSMLHFVVFKSFPRKVVIQCDCERPVGTDCVGENVGICIQILCCYIH